MTDLLTLVRPDDWHLHLRDGVALTATVPAAACQFARAVIMPNLNPAVVNTAAALNYHKRIMACVPAHYNFQALMTLYLTDTTHPEEIERAKDCGAIFACKFYPAGASTHSSQAVTDLKCINDVLIAMAEQGLPLLIHGEVTDSTVDIFDREAVFIQKVLTPLVEEHPKLKIVLEHISTQQAVAFILDAPHNVAATITAHHLLLNRNHMLVGGVKPHYYCLPVLKREIHRQALLSAATSANPKFFLGSDSAPHRVEDKQSACGCAGIYTGSYTLAHYAEAFDEVNALDKLEAFASFYGPDFYGLARNSVTLSLERRCLQIPQHAQFGNDPVNLFKGGEHIKWCLNAA